MSPRLPSAPLITRRPRLVAARPRAGLSRLLAVPLLGVLAWVGPSCRTEAPAPASSAAPTAGQSTPNETAEPQPHAEPSAQASEAEPDAGPEREVARTLPDLVALMRGAGWPDASPAELLDFVPVPPGAVGQAAIFGSGTEQVRVAVILYANDRFAQPHRTDVEERRRLLPDLPEAVAQLGPLVVHVRASERERAEALAAELADRIERTR